MVAPDGDQARNSSSGYPTIERSEVTDAQTPSVGLVQNLNLDFNAVWVQAIIETIQRLAPDGSPLALLAQQEAEAVNLIVAEKSTGVLEVKPHLQPVQGGIYLSTMRAVASRRTAMHGNTAVIRTTFATS
jgi:hypothetical protein